MRSTKPAALLVSFLLILAACGGAAGPGGTATPTAPGGTPPGGGTATETPGGGGSPGGGGGTAGDCVPPGTNQADGSVEGSIESTGAYSATWTFVVGNNGIAVGIGGASGTIGLTANGTGPGADLHVDSTGNIRFGGILSGLQGEDLPDNVGQIFEGTGGQATFCQPTDTAPQAYLCAVSLDNDVIGTTDATATLHLNGTLTIKGSMPTTLGGLTITCPS